LLAGHLQLWMAYGLALGVGVTTAFSLPSGTALLPAVMDEPDLASANSIMLAARQASLCIGPLAAGFLVALNDGGGLGTAFVVTAGAFLLSGVTLARIAVRSQSPAAADAGGMIAAMMDGARHCWRDRGLRACLMYWGALAFFISGPLQVAIPVQAAQFQSAQAFGVLMAAYGGGTFIGMVASAIKPDWRIGSLGTTVLAVDLVVAGLVIAMGAVSAVWQGAVLLVAIGTLGGYLHAAVFTWMQGRVPPPLMGRAMSLFMFIFVGVAPLSAAAAGWLLRAMSPSGLYVCSGMLLLGIVGLAFFASPLPRVADHRPLVRAER
jgi:hypothetical protein